MDVGMDSSLTALVENIVSRTSEKQDEALTQLAMLLEKNTNPCNIADFYESMLPEELLHIEMSSEDQRELLREVARNVPDAPQVASQFMWAIGKAREQVALEALDQSLGRHPEWIESPEVVYQALIALDNCLDEEQGKMSAEVKRMLNSESIIKLVKHAIVSKDDRLSDHGNRLADKITIAGNSDSCA
jgi:hypothetical protein